MKVSNIKFHENPSSDSRVFRADGQMDRQTWRVNSRFRNYANANKNAFFVVKMSMYAYKQ